MEELHLAHAEFLRTVNITPNANLTNQQVMREVRCFFCNKTMHQLGLKFCPKVKMCIKEGLLAYPPLERLVCLDRSELPCSFGSDGEIDHSVATGVLMLVDVLQGSELALVHELRPLAGTAKTRSRPGRKITHAKNSHRWRNCC